MKNFVFILFFGVVMLSTGCQQEPVKDGGSHSEQSKSKSEGAYGDGSYRY